MAAVAANGKRVERAAMAAIEDLLVESIRVARRRATPGRPVRSHRGPLGRRARARPFDRDRARRDPRAHRLDVEPVRGGGLDARAARHPSRGAHACAGGRGGIARTLRARVDPARAAVDHVAGGARADDRRRRAPDVRGPGRGADRDAAPAHQHHGHAGARDLRPRPVGEAPPARRRPTSRPASWSRRSGTAHTRVRPNRSRSRRCAGRPIGSSPRTTWSRTSPGSRRCRSRSAASPAPRRRAS